MTDCFFNAAIAEPHVSDLTSDEAVPSTYVWGRKLIFISQQKAILPLKHSFRCIRRTGAFDR